MELLSSSPFSAATVCVLSVIVAVIPLWAVKMVNTLWLRPKRLEKLLRAQGLHGDPYSLSPSTSNQNQSEVQQQKPDSESFALSDDVAPRLSTSLYYTIAKYGKKSFFWEGRTPKVIISEPNQIKEVFNNIHNLHKPKLSGNAKFLMNGLLSYEGEKWAKHRRIINPAFHLEKFKNMIPAFSQSCYDMISMWEGMLSSDGKCEIDVFPFLQNLSRDAISRTAFGSSYAEGEKIFQLLKMQGYLVMMTAKYNNIPILRYLPTAINKKMRAVDKDIHDSIEVIIKKKEKAMKNGETCNEDLLSILLESNKMETQGHGNGTSAGMTYEEVIGECKLFYLAGQETTSSLLVWAMIFLSRYPEWQARAREEVLHVFGNQTPKFDGLSQLKVVTMVIYEVLRLYPPTIFFNRTLQKDMNLGNLSLPAGVKVALPIFLLHQDGDIWGDDAKEFNPQRFSEGIAKATKGQLSFYPFGWGPRICIGQNFALLEAKIVLSLLLQNFSFELSPNYKHAPTAVLSLQPKHGAPIVLHKLQNPS
ncbi:11-oxo-beta-amyrin 30-oxidase-like [Vigna unguiculata]|uniref:11-oxo-beta-amyrin 30-oxidase-like n=1 Tax=Vigna unguiculata TaxID=3917 RepID=UPI0010168295|nr:11-oxo-beta-amyrin 30-oxidase-like [Vigna unguiculata]